MKSSTKLAVTFLCFFCCFTITTISIAQDGIGEEVMVHTKDRSVYRGVLTVDNDRYLRLKIQTNDTLSIPKADISRINYEADYKFYNAGKSHRTAGYFLSGTFGLGSDNRQINSLVEIELLGGKILNSRIAAGLVLGLNDFYFEIDQFFANQSYFNFGGHVRYYLSKHRVRTFLYNQLSFGTVVSNSYLQEELGNQVKIQNGIGLHFASKKRYRIVVSFAHNLQHIKGRTQVWGEFNGFFNPSNFRDFDFWSSNAVVKIGLEF